MAGSELQNCQRIVVLLWLASLAGVTALLTVRLIKKRIDLHARPQQEEPPSESAADKYREEASHHQFDRHAAHSTALTDHDTCADRLVKKACDYNVNFAPLLLALPLNLVLGRSKAFSIAIFFMAATACYLFNVFKVHRACVQAKPARLFLESLWLVAGSLLLVNVWMTEPAAMLYRLVQ